MIAKSIFWNKFFISTFVLLLNLGFVNVGLAAPDDNSELLCSQLYASIVEADAERFSKLLEKYPTCIKYYHKGESLLTFATKQKNVEIVRILNKKGMDAREKNGAGQTSLQIAFNNKDVPVLREFAGIYFDFVFKNTAQGENVPAYISFFDLGIELNDEIILLNIVNGIKDIKDTKVLMFMADSYGSLNQPRKESVYASLIKIHQLDAIKAIIEKFPSIPKTVDAVFYAYLYSQDADLEGTLVFLRTSGFSFDFAKLKLEDDQSIWYYLVANHWYYLAPNKVKISSSRLKLLVKELSLTAPLDQNALENEFRQRTKLDLFLIMGEIFRQDVDRRFPAYEFAVDMGLDLSYDRVRSRIQGNWRDADIWGDAINSKVYFDTAFSYEMGRKIYFDWNWKQALQEDGFTTIAFEFPSAEIALQAAKLMLEVSPNQADQACRAWLSTPQIVEQLPGLIEQKYLSREDTRKCFGFFLDRPYEDIHWFHRSKNPFERDWHHKLFSSIGAAFNFDTESTAPNSQYRERELFKHYPYESIVKIYSTVRNVLPKLILQMNPDFFDVHANLVRAIKNGSWYDVIFLVEAFGNGDYSLIPMDISPDFSIYVKDDNENTELKAHWFTVKFYSEIIKQKKAVHFWEIWKGKSKEEICSFTKNYYQSFLYVNSIAQRRHQDVTEQCKNAIRPRQCYWEKMENHFEEFADGIDSMVDVMEDFGGQLSRATGIHMSRCL